MTAIRQTSLAEETMEKLRIFFETKTKHGPSLPMWDALRDVAGNAEGYGKGHRRQEVP